jgi:hypothetical protein
MPLPSRAVLVPASWSSFCQTVGPGRGHPSFAGAACRDAKAREILVFYQTRPALPGTAYVGAGLPAPAPAAPHVHPGLRSSLPNGEAERHPTPPFRAGLDPLRGPRVNGGSWKLFCCCSARGRLQLLASLLPSAVKHGRAADARGHQGRQRVQLRYGCSRQSRSKRYSNWPGC